MTTIAAPPSAPVTINNLYPSLSSSLAQAKSDATTLSNLVSAWPGYDQTQINAAIQNDLLPIMQRLVQGTINLGNALGAVTNLIDAAPS